jgi:hypothetical protein
LLVGYQRAALDVAAEVQLGLGHVHKARATRGRPESGARLKA